MAPTRIPRRKGGVTCGARQIREIPRATRPEDSASGWHDSRTSA